MSDEWIIFIQLLVVGTVIAGVLAYVIRSLVCKAKNDVASKAVLVIMRSFKS